VVVENWRSSEVISSNGLPLELDIFLPKERLALEYQGEHHFKDIYQLGIKWERKRRDEEKRKGCKEKHITLIEVPYWWDKEFYSLAETIRIQRPDLISGDINGTPIPEINPKSGTKGKSSRFLTEYFRQRSTLDAWRRLGWNSGLNWLVRGQQSV
jgi:hypothetical protein